MWTTERDVPYPPKLVCSLTCLGTASTAALRYPACILLPCAPRSCWATLLLRTRRMSLLQCRLCPCRLLPFPLLCQRLCCPLPPSSCPSSPAPWPPQWPPPLRACPPRPLRYSRQQTHLCPRGLRSRVPALLSSSRWKWLQRCVPLFPAQATWGLGSRGEGGTACSGTATPSRSASRSPRAHIRRERMGFPQRVCTGHSQTPCVLLED